MAAGSDLNDRKIINSASSQMEGKVRLLKINSDNTDRYVTKVNYIIPAVNNISEHLDIIIQKQQSNKEFLLITKFPDLLLNHTLLY